MKKCQKKDVSYIEMEVIINKYWITSKDLEILLPQLTSASAQREFKKVKEEMKENKEFFFETRPVLLPIEKFIKKFNIDKKLIRSEASKIRKGAF